MARTNATLVQAYLGGDYDVDGAPDLNQYITFANLLVSRVVACASKKGQPITDEEAEMLERLIACHGYQASDTGYSSKTTSNASGTFQGQTGMKLESTRYGQDALSIDFSGCLTAIVNRQVAGGFWPGYDPPNVPIYPC